MPWASRWSAPPAELVERLAAYAERMRTVNPYAVGLTVFTLLTLAFWPRVSRRVPSPLVALLAGTAAAQLLDLPVETIGARFGDIPSSLPSPALPSISFAELRELVGPAFAIATLGAIESLLSAVVADGMIGGRHRSNMELVAQGVANIVSPLFGGMPATGAIARTATNIKSGGRTPVAGMVHALTLLLITLFFGRWAELIPLAALAAILLVVAYHLSEWRVFVSELHAPKSDALVMLTTFLLTVLVDLTVGDRRRDGAGGVPLHEADGRGHQRQHPAARSSRRPTRPRATTGGRSTAGRSRRAWRSTRSTGPSSSARRRSSRRRWARSRGSRGC